MMNDLKRHAVHYFLLLLIFMAGGIAFFSVSDHLLKFRVVILVSAAYFLWGFLHHFSENNLTSKVVVEYLLMSALSVTLLGGILL